VTYLKTDSGFEVDFLSRKPDGDQELIQVCADATDPEVLKRELRALEGASHAYPQASQTLITFRGGHVAATFPPEVNCIPVYEWL
jgi:hypothetical protein